MRDTDQSTNGDKKPELPKMEKPVTGEFEKNRRKMRSMMKQNRSNRKKANQ